MFVRSSIAAVGASVAATASYLLQSRSVPVLADEKEIEPKLVQVQVIFRHGARTPVFVGDELKKISFNLCKGVNRPPGVSFDAPPVIPGVVFAQLQVTDIDGDGPRPYSSVDRFQAGISLKGGECRLGQLTEKGAIQSSELGRELRERYKDKIPITEENLAVRSTNVGRCLGTLSAMLGSFLDLGETKKSKRNHKVIPVRTIQSNKEYMTPNHSNCEVLRFYFRQGREKLAEQFKASDNHLRKAIEDILPEEIVKELKVNEDNYIRIHDWVKILKTHRDKVVEEELKAINLHKLLDDESINDMLRKQAGVEVATLIGAGIDERGNQSELTDESKEKLKFAIGLFLRELYDNLFNHKKQKIYLFSGHDTTIIPLLIALGLYDMEWPDYCANIAIELWDTSGGMAEESTQSDSESVSDLVSPINVKQNIEHYEVRILYNGKEVKRMDLSSFKEYCQGLIPKNEAVWNRDCALIPYKERQKIAKLGPGGTSF